MVCRRETRVELVMAPGKLRLTILSNAGLNRDDDDDDVVEEEDVTVG